MDHPQLLDEKWILATADALGDLVEDMASTFIKSAPLMEQLEALGDEAFVSSLLKTRAGIGQDELTALRALARILRENPGGHFAAAKLSPATAVALQGASDQVRLAAQDVLQDGGRLDGDTIDRLESYAHFTSMAE